MNNKAKVSIEKTALLLVEQAFESIHDDASQRELPKILVDEYQNSTLAELPPSLPLPSKSQKMISVKEYTDKTDQPPEPYISIAAPMEIKSASEPKVSNEEHSLVAGSPTSKPSKKMSFLRTLSRKSFRKNKDSSNPSLSARYNENDDVNHIQIPKMSRSSSVGYLSEVFHDVHNLCIIPASVSDKLMDKKRHNQTYGSENSSVGDISTTSTASSNEYRVNFAENKGAVMGRSTSLTELATSAEGSSPLGLITPAIVKQRNYLFGGPGSLLGAAELQRYFPDRSVTIFVATWNMNGKPSPPSLDDFLLPDEMDFMPDMFVIGTQESDSNLTEFEVILQTSIGPSHVLFSSATFGILHLTVFLRRDLVWFCSVPEEDSHGLRPGTYFKTKGAVAISFQFFGTRILLINTHLFAHEEKLDQRIHNYKNIIHGIELPKNLRSHKFSKSKDVTHRYDIVFWMGDLNFRLVGNRERILNIISVANTQEDFDELLKHDQLTATKNKGEVFNGFDEGQISFRPTFKFDVGTNRYDTSSKQRVPSFTDRILYRSTRDPIQCIRYDSCPTLKTSDHKPVWGLYRFKVRQGKDDVPLAAGLFNRDIYLEALKRRRRMFHQPSSRGCQTQ